MKIILASNSPRRKELLNQLGLNFDIIPADIDETLDADYSPYDAALITAEKKARHICSSVQEDCIIIAADTLVAIDNQILGKPENNDHAKEMLSLIQGKKHTVFTGVSLVCKSGGMVREKSFVESADVFIAELSDSEIEKYIKTGEPSDKAGAYAAQGIGALFVERVEGDFFAVVGLPMARLRRELKEFDFDFL